jgi:hypothetical protein
MRVIKFVFSLGFSFFLLGFVHTAQAKIFIWRIGKPDNNISGNEFSRPETKVIDYIVPQNWEVLFNEDNPDWSGFPQHLYTSLDNRDSDDHEIIQEITINFAYPCDHHNPVLVVRAETSDVDPNVYFALEIMKFDKKIHIDLKRMNNKYRFINYEFPLGLIKAGDISEKNEIVIRCAGPPQGYIVFDALYLYYDDTDSDQDGVWDSDEGDAKSDPRTSSLPKIGRDPAYRKIFTLHIYEPEGITPCFRNVRFVDPNTLIIPEHLKSGYYFPYGFLGLQIDEVDSEGQVALQVTYEYTYKNIYQLENGFSPYLYCFAYQDSKDWREMDFSFVEGNSIGLELRDGGIADYDGGDPGSIDTIIAFAYPQELEVTVEKRGCFLQSISFGR